MKTRLLFENNKEHYKWVRVIEVERSIIEVMVDMLEEKLKEGFKEGDLVGYKNEEELRAYVVVSINELKNPTNKYITYTHIMWRFTGLLKYSIREETTMKVV